MDEGQPRAVVCDDDAGIRHYVSRTAERCGFDVVGEAQTALDAIDMVEAFRSDLIILDLALVGMPGLQAIPRLKEYAPDCIILALSAFDTLEHEARNAGADEWLDKADLADLDDLLTRLAGVITARRQPQ